MSSQHSWFMVNTEYEIGSTLCKYSVFWCCQGICLNWSSLSHFLFQGPASTVAFSRAGDYFASGGSDEQVRCVPSYGRMSLPLVSEDGGNNTTCTVVPVISDIIRLHLTIPCILRLGISDIAFIFSYKPPSLHFKTIFNNLRPYFSGWMGGLKKEPL